jgi:pilus assembly protein Flp/PilA
MKRIRPSGLELEQGGEQHMWSTLYSYITALPARLDIRNETGQTLVEYALIIALVAILCIGALTALSGGISSELNKVVTSL